MPIITYIFETRGNFRELEIVAFLIEIKGQLREKQVKQGQKKLRETKDGAKAGKRGIRVQWR